MSSSTSEPSDAHDLFGHDLFGQALSSPAVDAATGDRAWLQAMLAVEAAVARAAAGQGLAAPAAAATVSAVCADPDRFDLAAIRAGLATAATPVIELVAQLRRLVPPDAHAAVHVGLTSQDVVDTAAVLVARSAITAIVADARAVADRLADLARTHRDDVQPGRSLLQHGEVTTFGLACALRLVALDAAVAELTRHSAALPLQLGGAVGTRAGWGASAAGVVQAVAADLGLRPAPPWHTARGPLVHLAGALGVLAGELAATAQDVVLLSQTEIAEVAVAAPGGSSAMPHKRNPSRAVLAVAAAHRAPGLVATLHAAMPQELQRSAGRWQAEPATLVELLRVTGGAAAHSRAALTGLHVDTGRMRAAAQALTAVTGPRDLTAAAAMVDDVLHARGARADDPLDRSRTLEGQR